MAKRISFGRVENEAALTRFSTPSRAICPSAGFYKAIMFLLYCNHTCDVG